MLAAVFRQTSVGQAKLLFAVVVRALVMTTLVLLVLASPAWAELSGEPDNVPQTDGVVLSVLPVGDRIYIGGDFAHVGGVPRERLAAIDASTGEVTAWNPGANDKVSALASSPDGSRIYAGGSFTAIGGAPRNRLAAIGATTGAVDTNFRTGANSTVRAIAVAGTHVYVGGNFTTVQGQSRMRLALVDGTTGALNPNWTPAADTTVRALNLSPEGSRLYTGGEFTSISGQSRQMLAALDPANTGAPLPWAPRVNPNGPIFDLAVSGSRVYAAAAGPGGAAEAYDAATGARAWQLRGDGDGQAVAVMGTEVYVGGHFINFAGQRRPFFAAADTATGVLDSRWAPSGGGGKLSEVPSTGVWDLGPDTARGRLYAGTNFATVNGQAHAGFVQFSSSTEADTVPPETSIDSGPSGTINVRNATFTFSSSEQGSTFECSLDNGAFASCTSPRNYVSLPDGSHTFQVKATDAAGNTDATPASRTWAVDTTGTQTIPSSADTKLAEPKASTNYGDVNAIGVDGDEPAGSGKDASALLRFDVSTIPAGSKIRSASVTLNVTNSSVEAFRAYEIKRPWVETAATWMLYAASLPWEIAGANGTLDRAEQPAGTITPLARGKQTFDLSPALVQNWVDNSASNQGVIIADTTNTDGFDFYTREGTSNQRPQLSVAYTAP
jgi:hypothetical protein